MTAKGGEGGRKNKRMAAQDYLPQRDAAVLTGEDNLNYDDYNNNDNFPQSNISDVYYDDEDGIHGQPLVYSEAVAQNVAVLALVLLIGLILNLVAVPVILFRRTRFGNGLFAVLILCLTLSDVAVLLLSVLGSLVMEIGHLLWGGAPGSCQVRVCTIFFLAFYSNISK